MRCFRMLWRLVIEGKKGTKKITAPGAHNMKTATNTDLIVFVAI